MNIWKNLEQFFLLISNIMYKYSIFVLIGIVLFLLWNNYDGFSIGNPYGSFIRSLMNPSGDINQDMLLIQKQYSDVQGKITENYNTTIR